MNKLRFEDFTLVSGNPDSNVFKKYIYNENNKYVVYLKYYGAFAHVVKHSFWQIEIISQGIEITIVSNNKSPKNVISRTNKNLKNINKLMENFK